MSSKFNGFQYLIHHISGSIRIIMKHFLFTFLFLICFHSAKAQSNYINANNIKTYLSNNGRLFQYSENLSGVEGFLVPYTEGENNLSTFFLGGLACTAVDEKGNTRGLLHIEGSYMDSKKPGPTNYEDINVDFDKVWKVSRIEIENLKTDFLDGVLDQEPAQSLLVWPASGNPFLGLPIQEMAPFYDANGDNIYSPFNGDYPIIGEGLEAVNPDEILYTVLNDNHKGEERMGLESHIIMYALNNQFDEVLNNTLFTRHKVINKGDHQLKNGRIGMFLDSDVGCLLDDYFGTSIENEGVFFYNKDNDDDLDCSNFPNGYGLNPPVQTAYVLNHSLHSSMNILGIVGAPLEEMTDPDCPVEMARILNGIWKDGTPLTAEGNGYNPENTNITRYAYDGNPAVPSSWNLLSENPPFTDRKIFVSVILDDLDYNDSFIIDMAYTYTRVTGADHIENIDFALNDMAHIRSLYEQGLDINTSVESEFPNAHYLTIFPNPSDGRIQLTPVDKFDFYEVYNLGGSLLLSGRINNSQEYLDLDLDSGSYFLKIIQSSTGIFHTNSLIIIP